MLMNFKLIVCSMIDGYYSNLQFKLSTVIKINSCILIVNLKVFNSSVSLNSEKGKHTLKESNINSSDH